MANAKPFCIVGPCAAWGGLQTHCDPDKQSKDGWMDGWSCTFILLTLKSETIRSCYPRLSRRIMSLASSLWQKCSFPGTDLPIYDSGAVPVALIVVSLAQTWFLLWLFMAEGKAGR